jgi:class 3 adenylate cyclase
VCGTENREDRKFCRECGNSLTSTCPQCGAGYDAGDKFCGACGVPLASTEPATETPAADEVAGAELRFVSVLFADLVGFTTYSEQRDSEEVRDMLTTYFERAREIIERFGGTVDKFIGDAVMGVWGATSAREDDAERAVRAALELVDKVKALAHELNEPDLSLRVGVNSGSTSVGPGGNDKGLVVGDLVNTASRLQSIADPGTVFVGSATQTVTNRAIDYEPMGERSVKGKVEGVEAWRALRVAGLVGGKAEGELRNPPFVGRGREMRFLKDQLMAVESEQRARLVSIVGEGGIGKTRLAEEFKNHLDGFTADIYWHQGRSPSYHDGVTFWALGEMVRRRAGIVEGEEPARARTRLRTCVAEFVPGAEDRRWIEPRLEGLLGLGDMPPGGRAELFSALRSFFHHIAERGTTVLVFEDLHWTDDGLVDFIAELVERSNRSPLLVITHARPDLLDRYPNWGTQHRSSMAMRLAPLTDDDMRQMIGEYLPGVEEPVVERIVERSAGFPLYAVEMVRMMIGSGELEEAEGQFRFHGDASSMALPESLQAVIGARLDRLDPAARGLLQDGAVLGQTFTLPAIARLSGETVDDIDDRLRTLVQVEILDIEDDPRSPERGQYRFIQSLIHEVAYRRLSRQDRRSKHLAAAGYFESFDDPELAGVVAGHLMQAYGASPDGADRDALAARALQGLAEAAARAAALGSHVQAMGLLDQAIALSLDPDEQARFRLEAAGYAAAQSEVERGVAYIEDARLHYEVAGDVDGTRRAATAHSAILNSHFRSDEALAVIKPVYEGLDRVDDLVTIGVAAEAARSFSLMFDREAITAVERLLPAAADLGLHEITVDSLVTRGTALWWHGRVAESRVLLRGAAAVAEDQGLLRVAGRAHNNLASTLFVDNPREAARIGERVNELATRIGDFGWMVRSTSDAAGNLIGDGRYEEAIARLDLFEEDQLSEFWQNLWAIHHASIELQRGTAPDAFERYMEAASFFDGDDDPQLRASMDAGKCWANRMVGNLDASFELAMQIDHINTGQGLFQAATTAAWARRLDWVEMVAAALEENTNQGNLIDGLQLFVDGTAAALRDDADTAVERFGELIDLFGPIVFSYDLSGAQATVAMLVGQDHPLGAQAARDAYEWVTATGSDRYLELWAEGLPADAARGGRATG